MSLLLSLPRDVWCDKVVSFLELSEIVRVDSAIAKSGHERVTYQSNLSGSILNQQIELGVTSHQHIAWLDKHNIAPKSLVIQRDYSFESSALPSLFSHAEDLTFEASSLESDEQFELVMHYCMHHIVSLTIAHCHALNAETFLGVIARCPKLTTIRVFHCMNIDEATLATVPALCQKLRHFSSIRYVLTPIVSGFANFGKLLSFEFRHAGRNFVSEAQLDAIARCMPNLTSLKLSTYTAGATHIAFDALCRGCPQLHTLHLTGFADMNDAATRVITTHLPLLRDLSVRDSPHLTYDGIAQLARAYPDLRVLDASNCNSLQNDSIILLGSLCRSLTSLSVAQCSLLTDLALRTLNHSTLIHLDVSATDVNGSFVARLLSPGAVLTSLNVSNCKHMYGVFADSMPANNNIRTFTANSTRLTKVMWLKLNKLLPNVRTVSAVMCIGVTDEVVQEFALQHPFLRYFNALNCKVSKEMFDMFRFLRDDAADHRSS